MPATRPHIRDAVVTEINGVRLYNKKGFARSRYSNDERLQILGLTWDDLQLFASIFCPGVPLFAVTRGRSSDHRDWITSRGRLNADVVLRHLLGNTLPGIFPIWVAPRSWEVTRFVALDVDYREDQGDFLRRRRAALRTLKRLGIPPSDLLISITPSGGRHYRFFLQRKVRVKDIPRLFGLLGLRECSGQIEIFPKMKKGLRLPFGYVPGRVHDITACKRFLDGYRSGEIRLVNWLTCIGRAERFAQRQPQSTPLR